LKRFLLSLLAAVMIFSIAACNDNNNDNSSDNSSNNGGDNSGDDYAAFTKAMIDMRDEGKKLAEQGLDFGAQSLYAFSGSSLSSLRYAVENILWLKGEGESIEDITNGSRYAGWDEIAAVCYASPYPYYFEGLLYHVQGMEDESTACYTSALLNPAYPKDGVDFYYLKNMEVADLYKLRDELRVMENDVYALYALRPARIERDEYTYHPEYLRAKSREALERGDNADALAFARAALTNNSVDPLNFRNAVLCAIAAGDVDSAIGFLNAGLQFAPGDEGLLTLKEGFDGG